MKPGLPSAAAWAGGVVMAWGLGAGSIGEAWATPPAAPAAVAAPAFQRLSAEDGAKLAAQRNCLGCHHATQRRAGPPLTLIARRYNAVQDPKAQAATLELLAGKIRHGGRGAWGVVPMPANRQVTETEARQLVAWILDHHR